MGQKPIDIWGALFNLRADTGPRKLKLYFDEDLQALRAQIESQSELRKKFKFMITEIHADDRHVWQIIKARQAVLVTANERDFGKDNEFKQKECFGLIIVSGRNTEEQYHSLLYAIKEWQLLSLAKRLPEALRGMKINTSINQSTVTRWVEGKGIELIGVRAHPKFRPADRRIFRSN